MKFIFIAWIIVLSSIANAQTPKAFSCYINLNHNGHGIMTPLERVTFPLGVQTFTSKNPDVVNIEVKVQKITRFTSKGPRKLTEYNFKILNEGEKLASNVVFWDTLPNNFFIDAKNDHNTIGFGCQAK